MAPFALTVAALLLTATQPPPPPARVSAEHALKRHREMTSVSSTCRYGAAGDNEIVVCGRGEGDRYRAWNNETADGGDYGEPAGRRAMPAGFDGRCAPGSGDARCASRNRMP